MIIYESTKEKFMTQVEEDCIAQIIYDEFQAKIGRTSRREILSWENSMQYMYKVLNTNEIPDLAGVAIEYRLAATSKRIDFILTGTDHDGTETAVIIELKQWSEAKQTDKPDIVQTYLGKGFREVTHPSYQAWSYATILQDYNLVVQHDDILLKPCVYMHNYLSSHDDPILDKQIYPIITEAPIFKKGDVTKLRVFISKYIKKADENKILYRIDHGKIRPSKSLQDSLVQMLQGNQEFTMIDSQKVVFENILKITESLNRTENQVKNVVIIEGGPGTGKSVLAINLLVALTAKELVCQYVTKNQAPREVYRSKLQSVYKKKQIDNLFKGSGTYVDALKNEIDVLIVDEAHRLNERSGMFSHLGENQTKEVINASKFSVFFIDENQRVTAKDKGTIDEIQYFAKQASANVHRFELDSQFRCNGSDGYISWLDDVLGIKETANFEGFSYDYDLRIFDNPHDLRTAILEKNALNNKARIVAGYCWEWLKNGKNDSGIHDIYLPAFDFGISWNLSNSSTWAIDSESVYEAGCIHTCQGLEFDYVGVIIGEDLRFEENQVITDYTKRAKTDKSLTGLKGECKKGNVEALQTADEIIRNTYRTLLTRGQKGCYIYCENKELSDYLEMRMNHNEAYKTTLKEQLLASEESYEFLDGSRL